jgi:type I restriction enzyme R subunit
MNWPRRRGHVYRRTQPVYRNVRKAHEQLIDLVNVDYVQFAGWKTQAVEKANELTVGFGAWIEAHKDEITALQIFYGQPYRRRELSTPW